MTPASGRLPGKNRLSLAVSLFALSLAAQTAQQPSLRSFSESLHRLVGQVSPAVVQIIAQRLGGGGGEETESGRMRSERGTGSGVIVDPDGYIVTNAHVVGTSTHIQVLLPD